MKRCHREVVLEDIGKLHLIDRVFTKVDRLEDLASVNNLLLLCLPEAKRRESPEKRAVVSNGMQRRR